MPLDASSATEHERDAHATADKFARRVQLASFDAYHIVVPAIPLPADFEARVRAMPDAELLDVLVHADDYLPGAADVARAEAARRQLSDQQFAAAHTVSREADAAFAAREDVTLSPALRLICFLVPLNLWMIFAAIRYNAEGFTRKARDVVQWMLCGACAYGTLVILVVVFGTRTQH